MASTARRRNLSTTLTAVAIALTGTLSAAPASGGQTADQRTKPTIVLVHGAWADASSWNGEVSLLRRAGYTVRAIGNPLENLTTDAQTVQDFLKTIKGPIVLAGHSYGGSVITNAAQGVGNVKALVYVDAAAPAVGETTARLSGPTSVLTKGSPADLYDAVPYANAPSKASALYLKQDVFVTKFASSVRHDQALGLWATQRAATTVAFNTPSKYAAWKTIPSWYFISTGDQIITPDSEKAMARRAGSKVTLYKGGSHLTLVSDPAAVTKVIQSAAASVH
ncbi:alpha/beta hydrolase [Streptomyces sp. NPDC048409]|jgi:pimeloyl-ACP methyl ester carboxylesterase|uniref:alpha/beta hydrolase n=1 Tax=unclassified Streptomyces TaxID=2593676 RepID=UPI00342A247F